MTAPHCKVTLPAFVAEHGERLRRYHLQNISWGALHVCLDDGNWTLLDEEDAERAETVRGDREGAALVRLVMQLSPSQRSRLESHMYPERRR